MGKIQRLKGGAQRVLKYAKTPDHENSTIEKDLTPTADNLTMFEFNAPKYHDFENDNDDANISSWFDGRVSSPQDPTKQPRNLLNDNCSPAQALQVSESKVKGFKGRASHMMVLRKRSSISSKGVQVFLKDEPNSPFVPLAVRLQTFEKDVALRKPVSRARMHNMALTKPVSPMLTTKFRAGYKKTDVVSAAEREELEMNKIMPFKARPLNKKILKTRQQQGPVSKQPLTIPISPAITRNAKPRQGRNHQAPELFKANPLPDLSKPFVPMIETRKIDSTGFSLPGDSLHQKQQVLFQEKMSKEMAEFDQRRLFKAQAIGFGEKAFEVNFDSRVTEPTPFELQTDKRGEMYQSALNDKLKMSKLELKRAKEFHANPLPSTRCFVPSRSEKPLTEIQTFTSHLDTRMEERKIFEADVARKIIEQEELQAKFERKNQEKEHQEIRRLRKRIVHKAQPVKTYALPIVKPSEKPLTAPKTPHFVRRRAARAAKF